MTPNGYSVRIDGADAGVVPAVGRLVMAGVAPGTHTVTFSGWTSNCNLTGQSQSVIVRAGDTTVVSVSATCVRQLRNELAYSAWDFALSSVRPDGTGVEPITLKNSFDTQPAVSPDGTRIAFIRARTIFVCNADGTGETRLHRGYRPRWSPDGKSLVFIGDVNDWQNDVYFINVDGTDARRISLPGPVGENLSSVDWSPDGKTILYITRSNRFSYDNTLIAIDTSGANRRTVRMVANESLYEATYSRDGANIAATALDGGRFWNVVVMSADGSNGRKITVIDNALPLQHPSWSPDGKAIAVGVRIDPSFISIFNVDGSGVRRLSDGQWPDWSPVP